MGVVDLRKFDDDQIVIHYGGELTSVDAYTFGNSLVAFADTLRALNASLNPGQSIEVRLDAVGAGSFRAKIRRMKKGFGGFFSRAPENLFWSMFTLLVLQPTLQEQGQSTTVYDDRVEIRQGDDVIIVSREAFSQLPNVRSNPDVQRNLQRAFQVIEEDEAIENFGVTPKLDDKDPLVQIPRDDFANLAAMPEIAAGDGSKRRPFKQENVRLVILKAWLKGGSKRKWQFEWNGVPISAPITDQEFLGRMDRHEQLIGSGDAIDATLEFYQNFDENIGTWTNDANSYQVTSVHRYLSRSGEQTDLL